MYEITQTIAFPNNCFIMPINQYNLDFLSFSIEFLEQWFSLTVESMAVLPPIITACIYPWNYNTNAL